MPKTDLSAHTSDILHNKNCFQYLSHLSISDYILAKIREISEELYTGLLQVKFEAYQANFAYGDLYQLFFKTIEKNIESLISSSLSLTFEALATEYKHSPEEMSEENRTQLTELAAFFFSIYANESKILELTFDAIKDIPLGHFPKKQKIQTAITRHVNNDQKINKTHSPVEVGTSYLRLKTLFRRNYKPQHTTNIASVRQYQYKEPIKFNQTTIPSENISETYMPKEYRFGTQGQFHEGIPRISPLFIQWLKVQAFKRATQSSNGIVHKTPITHIYINNLGFDRSDYAGIKERQLTKALHNLEATCPNLCVITLPADKGLMQNSDYKKIGDNHLAENVYHDFLAVALTEENEPFPTMSQVLQASEMTQAKTGRTRRIRDFHISPRTRALLFSADGTYSKKTEKKILEQLLNTSFHTFGVDKTDMLSSAQKQAIWFHFLKFDLTQYIFNTLQPESINFTCKDAIDRGGIASLYYNLMRSYATPYPLSREEFERGLHAAPTLVKGRGINHHLKVIWNVIATYLDQEEHYQTINSNPATQWLIDWRDLNCPPSRVNILLKKRILQAEKEIETALVTPHPLEKHALLTQGLTVIQNIQQQQALGVTQPHQHLLLETVTRTLHILFRAPDEHNLKRYDAIVRELGHPSLFKTLRNMIQLILKTMLDILSRKTPSRYQQYSRALTFRSLTIHSMITFSHKAKKMNALSEKPQETAQALEDTISPIPK